MAITVQGFRPIEKVERIYGRRTGKAMLTIGANAQGKGIYARLSKTAIAMLNGTAHVSILSNGKDGEQVQLLLVSNPDGEFTLSKTGSLSGTSLVQAIGATPKAGTKIQFGVDAWAQGNNTGIRAHTPVVK